MPSSFSWLDFAETDRQRAMRVIDLFRERTTVDELGFAPIRDAFADHLFPGTSTIQTRARYFLFVPWIFQHYDRKAKTAQELTGKVRTLETRLIEAPDRGRSGPARHHRKARSRSVGRVAWPQGRVEESPARSGPGARPARSAGEPGPAAYEVVISVAAERVDHAPAARAPSACRKRGLSREFWITLPPARGD